MSVDTAFTRLRDANPVPEPGWLRDESQDLGALLTTTRQRSMDMSKEPEPLETQKPPTPIWRKAMPALVAAAVVILVAAGFLLLARNDEPEVAGSAVPISTFDGSGCTYEGPTEFDLNSEVKFTFVNASETTEVGFAVWAVPDGTTTEDIQNDGIQNVGAVASRDRYVEMGPIAPGVERPLTVILDKTGLHALNCVDRTTEAEGIDYATLITVSG